MIFVPVSLALTTLAAAPIVAVPLQSTTVEPRVVTIFERTFISELEVHRLDVEQVSASADSMACATEASRCAVLGSSHPASAYLRGTLSTTSDQSLEFSIEAVEPTGRILASEKGTAPTQRKLLDALREAADRMAPLLQAKVPNDARHEERLALASQFMLWGGLAGAAGGGALLYLGHHNAGLVNPPDASQRLSVDDAFGTARAAQRQQTIGAILLAAGTVSVVSGLVLWRASVHRVSVAVAVTPASAGFAVTGSLP